MCLLLYFCPLIEKLVLDNNFDDKYTWTLTSDAPNHETLWQAILSLDKLKEIDCDTTGQMRTPYQSDRVASLLRLPEINTIKISTHQDEINAGTSLEKIIAPNVKTLVLYNSLLKEETFGTIVATVPNITSLRLGIKSPTDHWGGFERWSHWLDCPKLFAALFHTGITQYLNDSTMLQPLQFLEELAISADFLTPGEERVYFNNFSRGSLGMIGRLGCLNGLSRLRSIEIPPEMLLGWWNLETPNEVPFLVDVLPDTITHLRFRSDYWFVEYSPSSWSVGYMIDYLERELAGPGIRRINNLSFVCAPREARDPSIARFKSVVPEVKVEMIERYHGLYHFRDRIDRRLLTVSDRSFDWSFGGYLIMTAPYDEPDNWKEGEEWLLSHLIPDEGARFGMCDL